MENQRQQYRNCAGYSITWFSLWSEKSVCLLCPAWADCPSLGYKYKQLTIHDEYILTQRWYPVSVSHHLDRSDEVNATHGSIFIYENGFDVGVSEQNRIVHFKCREDHPGHLGKTAESQKTDYLQTHAQTLVNNLSPFTKEMRTFRTWPRTTTGIYHHSSLTWASIFK